MRIVTKAVSGVVAVVVVVVALGAFGVVASSRSADNAQAGLRTVRSVRAIKTFQLDAATLAVAENSIAYDYASRSDPSADLQSFSDAVKATSADVATLAASTLTPAEQLDLHDAVSALATYKQQSAAINQEFLTRTAASVNLANQGVAALAFHTITQPLASLETSQTSAGNQLLATDRSSARRDRTIMLVMVLLAVLLAVGFGLAVVWRIRSALRQMSRAAARMTEGDLSTRLEHDADDEMGQLADSFNALASTLATTFDQLETDARRENFNTKLVEALEMVDTETDAHATVSLAMAQAGPYPTELLLSDSSRAHLVRSACHPEAGAPGCPVESPFQCAAVRRGTSIVFESSTELNACPKLRDRPGDAMSAVCVPVSFMGRALGVLHATAADRKPPTGEVVGRLAQIAAQAGSRIGTVRAFQQTQLQAATDVLTGLANRRTIEAQVRDLFAEGELFSFVMADLDFFKRLNDSNGHEMGDRALRLFSRVFTESLRAGDLAARWGGEEFAAVLHGVRAGEAVTVLDRLRSRLADATLAGETPSFTASFGVIDSATVGSLELLIRSADDALYAAKEAGRDRIVIGDPVLIKPTSRNFGPEHDSRINPQSPLTKNTLATTT